MLRDLLILQRALDDLEALMEDPRLPAAQLAGLISEYDRLSTRLKKARKKDRKDYD